MSSWRSLQGDRAALKTRDSHLHPLPCPSRLQILTGTTMAGETSTGRKFNILSPSLTGRKFKIPLLVWIRMTLFMLKKS